MTHPGATRPRIPGTSQPLCRHFGTCGGCVDLDVAAETAFAQKVRDAEQLLAPYLAGERIAWTPAPRVPLHARTRVLYPVGTDRRGRATLGLYARGSHDLVAIHECRTQDRRLTALGDRVGPLLDELGLAAYDPANDSGFVRALWARVSPSADELLVGLVTRPGEFPKARAFADAIATLVSRLPRTGRRPTPLAGVVRSIGEGAGNFLHGERHVPLAGRDHLTDRQDGLRFRLSAGSFYQLHRHATHVLYRPALEMLGDVRGLRVVDGYGGVGTFGLRLAKAGAASVRIVEDSASACRDAEHNAADNRLGQVTVTRGRFADEALDPDPDLMVVDPPRAGLGPDGVARVLTTRPRRLLHVACSVRALARDLEGLTGAGYRVRAARACDLFPFTAHVEVVALLERAP